MKQIMIFIIGFVLLTGCATTSEALPETLVITDTAGVDMDKYNADILDCRQYASQINPAKEITKGAILGAVVGGLIGAAANIDSDTTRSVAGVGAVAGAAGSGEEALSEQDQVIKKCLIGRGYKVLN